MLTYPRGKLDILNFWRCIPKTVFYLIRKKNKKINFAMDDMSTIRELYHRAVNQNAHNSRFYMYLYSVT